MKAISLWQPWASLVASGAKRFETRSWEPSYRGVIAIHAAQRWTKAINDLCDTEPFRTALEAAGITPVVETGRFAGRTTWPLPFGVLAVGRLVDVYQITRRGGGPVAAGRVVLATSSKSLSPDETELAFGDYTPGRYAWQIEDVRPLARPLLVPGRQSLFDIPDSLIASCQFEDAIAENPSAREFEEARAKLGPIGGAIGTSDVD